MSTLRAIHMRCTRTSHPADSEKNIALSLLGSYASRTPSTANVTANPLELAGSEIAAYDPKTKRLFITNAFDNTIDVSIEDPSNPAKITAVDLDPYGALPNSVAVHDGIVAVAVEASPKISNGKAVFFDADGNFLAAVVAGALPDMVTFTPDGRTVLVANEGEPSTYTTPGGDPEGSVSIIRLPASVEALSQSDVTTADFHAFNGTVLDSSIRIFGPGASISQDLEPEYIAVSDDSKTAWVTLQENNAIAELDIQSGLFVSLRGLGFKDHQALGAGLDGSDEDGPGTGAGARRFNVARWPVMGMYLPDAIATYRVEGRTYLLTANEGDLREWPGIAAESARLSSLAAVLPAGSCPGCLDDENGIRRLTVSRIGANATSSFSAPIDRLLSYGTRSFSIWTENLQQVFDSGDQLEQITKATLPTNTSMPPTPATQTGTRAAMTRDRSRRGSRSRNSMDAGMPSSRSNASAASWSTTSPNRRRRASFSTSTTATSRGTLSPAPPVIWDPRRHS